MVRYLELSNDFLLLEYSIEDPFETWYDVAHVIKSTQMAYIRKEFLVSSVTVKCCMWCNVDFLLFKRAYTIIARVFISTSGSDSLPSKVTSSSMIDILCSNCEPPNFSQRQKNVA